MAYQIRTPNLDDVDAIADLNCRLAAETEDVDLNRETVRRGVVGLITRPERGTYLLACKDNQIVGQLMHTREWSDWRDGEIWWLQSVYVMPRHRRKGVFRCLLDRLTESAKAENAIGLRLYVEQENRSAIDTYDHLGIEQTAYLVREQLFASDE